MGISKKPQNAYSLTCHMLIDMMQLVWSNERVKNMEAGNSVQQTLLVFCNRKRTGLKQIKNPLMYSIKNKGTISGRNNPL